MRWRRRSVRGLAMRLEWLSEPFRGVKITHAAKKDNLAAVRHFLKSSPECVDQTDLLSH